VRDRCVRNAFIEAVQWGAVGAIVGAGVLTVASKKVPSVSRLAPALCTACACCEAPPSPPPTISALGGGDAVSARGCDAFARGARVCGFPARGLVGCPLTPPPLCRPRLPTCTRWVGTTTKTGLIGA
jgi:hypothetical protein